MAKFRATINYTNGDRELRFYWTDSRTKSDIEYDIEHSPDAPNIKSYSVTYDETYRQTELVGEVSAIVDNYKNRFSARLAKAFNLR